MNYDAEFDITNMIFSGYYLVGQTSDHVGFALDVTLTNISFNDKRCFQVDDPVTVFLLGLCTCVLQLKPFS